MNVKINDQARENINQKVNALFENLEKLPNPIFPSFNTDPISTTLEICEDNIKIIDLKNGFIFPYHGEYFGIKESITCFTQIVEQIWKAFKLNNIVSLKYIDNKLKEWFRYKKFDTCKLEICEFIINELNTDVKYYEIYIPIPLTQLESDFVFGKVEFKTLTEELINAMLKTQDDDSILLKQELKTKYRSFAVGVQKIKGEPIYVKEKAFENISNSLSLIRLFSPANTNIESISGAYEKGHNYYESEKYIVTCESVNYISYNTGSLDNGLYAVLPNEFLDILLSEKYKGLHYLLQNELNEYQNELLITLKIYSKHCLKRDFFDRLLYIFASLEKIFIKNNTEAIQQNLSERIAFYIGNNLEERKRIIKNVKDVYQIRSRGVHHGYVELTDVDVINNFLILTWVVFEKMIFEFEKYKSISSFVESIDNIKLS